jgi:ABC-type uncharacterized transport system auxiliary subunit
MNRLAVLILAVAATGCISNEYIPTRYYALDIDAANTQATPSGLTLGVRPLEPVRPYQQADIWYREAPHRLEEYPHAEWAEQPRDAIGRALRLALVQGGGFQDVGATHNLVLPDLTLTGELIQLVADMHREPAAAICTVRLELRETRTGKLLWGKTLEEVEPIDAGAAVPSAAMSAAASRLVESAARSIAEAARL